MSTTCNPYHPTYPICCATDAALRTSRCHSGQLSRKGTADTSVLAVVSRKAMIEGSKRDDATGSRAGDTVAYAGRVPVRVRGPVRQGDHIVPSGLDDGTGVSYFDTPTG